MIAIRLIVDFLKSEGRLVMYIKMIPFLYKYPFFTIS